MERDLINPWKNFQTGNTVMSKTAGDETMKNIHTLYVSWTFDHVHEACKHHF
jgi:hypothetical protein